MIELIEQPQRRRRRRTEPAEPPQHVPGAANRLPDDDELPFQQTPPARNRETTP